MNKKGKRKVKTCVYCGQLKEVTKDHVIPKCLFIKPYPPNLISVPACDDCNNSKSLNDDYLRDILVTDNWVSKHPIAQQIFQQKMLSSQRQGSSVIARETIKNSKLEPFYTSGGIYLGHFHATPIDDKRFEHIFETMVRGLFYDFQKERIPDGYIFDLGRIHLWEFEQFKQMFESHKPKGKVLGNVFSGGFTFAAEDAFTTMWLLIFYERIAFCAFMLNPNLQHKLKTN